MFPTQHQMSRLVRRHEYAHRAAFDRSPRHPTPVRLHSHPQSPPQRVPRRPIDSLCRGFLLGPLLKDMLADGGGRTLGRVDGTIHLVERMLAERMVVEKCFCDVSIQPWSVRCKWQRCDMRGGADKDNRPNRGSQNITTVSLTSVIIRMDCRHH